jgi:uncharacterized OsmC-like protein
MADLVVTVTRLQQSREAIEMEVRGRADDPAALDKLVTIAERACIVHNTLAPAVPI